MSSKSSVSKRDQNPLFCNRTGCSGRIKSNQNTRTGNLDKAKCSRPSLRSSVENEVSSSVMPGLKKPYLDGKRKLLSQPKCDSSSESSLPSDSEVSELVCSPLSSSSSGYQSEIKKKYGKSNLTEVGSSSGSSNSVRTQKSFSHKSIFRNQNTALASSSLSAAGNRYGLRNLKCNSISDVAPGSCSSTDSNKNLMRKRSQEGESSSSHRERRTTTVSSHAVINGHISSSTTSGITITDSGQSSSATRRSMNLNNRINCSYRQNGRNYGSVRQSPVRISNNDIPFRVNGRSSSRQFSTNISSGASSRSHGLLNSNGDNRLGRMPFASSESSFTRLLGHDSSRRYNVDNIAEVLFALEMIGQDQELTHEQVLALETSLFLGGLNLHDQHRDMRLDIDNMSYEELLALEEKMGTVSTALSEDDLSKCLKTGIYHHITSQDSSPDQDGDDVKCSICQEAYEIGDETGTLVGCKHGYHMSCITRWLQMKNWCPICKCSAAASQRDLSS